MEAEAKRPITLYTEANPNPNSLKFVANMMLMPEGVSRDYPDLGSAKEAPLATKLFEQFAFVTRVFYMSNFVTVTKKDETNWGEVKAEVQRLISNYLVGGGALLTEETTREDHAVSVDDTDIEVKIKSILNEYIRPAVEMDGGAISFHSFDGGKVSVTLQGSCSGCPSATVTLKLGIENLLKRMVPEVTEVEAREI